MAVKKTPAKKTASKATGKKSVVKKASLKVAKKPASKTTRKSAKKSTVTPSIKPASPSAVKQPLDAFKEMEKIMTKQPFEFDKLAQEAANQSREGIEAFVKSGAIFAKGFEEIMKTAAGMTQGVAEKQAEYAKQLMSSKTLNEYTETQNKIAQFSFDQFMSDATKLSEMSVKVMNEASEPLNTQMAKTMTKANKAMAA